MVVSICLQVTVVAQERNDPPRKLNGKRCLCDLLVHVGPARAHVTHGLAAKGAGVPAVRMVLFKAASVYRVAAAQHLRRLKRVKQKVEAHRAVAVHCVGHAGVIVHQLVAVACATSIAVEELVAPSNAADATLVAMKLDRNGRVSLEMCVRVVWARVCAGWHFLFLCNVVVEEIAYSAEVCAEAEAATVATRGGCLLVAAAIALHACHTESVHLVLARRHLLFLVLRVIVTEAA